MLNNETMNKLRHMKLSGFIESLEQQENSADYREIDFNERAQYSHLSPYFSNLDSYLAAKADWVLKLPEGVIHE